MPAALKQVHSGPRELIVKFSGLPKSFVKLPLLKMKLEKFKTKFIVLKIKVIHFQKYIKIKVILKIHHFVIIVLHLLLSMLLRSPAP